MSCFDHSPILISQSVLPTCDQDALDAESRSHYVGELAGSPEHRRNAEKNTGKVEKVGQIEKVFEK